MKKLLLSVLVLGAINVNAQILNSNLESWTGVEPDDWGTLNQLQQFGADQTTIQETNDAGEGSSSALMVSGNCDICAGFLGSTTVPGFIQQAIAINYRPDSVYFLVKTGSAIGGAFLIDFSLTNAGDSVGSFQIVSNQVIPVWSPQVFPITYFTQGNPDTLSITFASGSALFGGPADVLGDSLFVDMIAMSDPAGNTAITEAELLNLTVYPTMATEMVTFEMEKQGVVIVDVYDALGKVVASEIVKSNKLQLNVASFQSGLYLYQVRDFRNNIIESGKFTKQ